MRRNLRQAQLRISLASGYLADRTACYWAITLVGYGLNLIAVPLLALAGRWEIAAALMICERVGKAIRTPHDANALTRHSPGRPWLGFRAARDDGPGGCGRRALIVAAVLATGGEYRTAFAVLLVPATVTLGILLLARWLYPSPRDLEPATPTHHGRGFPRAFWLCVAAAALVAAGYADFPLIAYHFGKTSVVPVG